MVRMMAMVRKMPKYTQHLFPKLLQFQGVYQEGKLTEVFGNDTSYVCD
jgi:hypothetical protein